MCAHRNSDNLHNAVSIGYSLVGRVMADEHLIVALRNITNICWQRSYELMSGRYYNMLIKKHFLPRSLALAFDFANDRSLLGTVYNCTCSQK